MVFKASEEPNVTNFNEIFGKKYSSEKMFDIRFNFKKLVEILAVLG